MRHDGPATLPGVCFQLPVSWKCQVPCAPLPAVALPLQSGTHGRIGWNSPAGFQRRPQIPPKASAVGVLLLQNAGHPVLSVRNRPLRRWRIPRKKKRQFMTRSNIPSCCLPVFSGPCSMLRAGLPRLTQLPPSVVHHPASVPRLRSCHLCCPPHPSPLHGVLEQAPGTPHERFGGQ